MSAKEILSFLEQRRLISTCVEWCLEQGPQYQGMNRYLFYRAADREEQQKEQTARTLFLLEIAKKFVEMRKGMEAQAA